MWQDFAFAAGGFVFTACLVPILRNPRAGVPRSSSVVTSAFLALYTVAYASLGMHAAAVMEGVMTLAWAAIAVWRPVRSRVSETALGEVAVDMAITEAEYELVQRYREAMGRSSLTVVQDGCGTCPSAQK
jgi:hypothetical protein